MEVLNLALEMPRETRRLAVLYPDIRIAEEAFTGLIVFGSS
jgi:hypothetical protein